MEQEPYESGQENTKKQLRAYGKAQKHCTCTYSWGKGEDKREEKRGLTEEKKEGMTDEKRGMTEEKRRMTEERKKGT